MERALILVGKYNNIESYQLLIKCDYIYHDYNGSMDRSGFFEELSNAFVRKIEENSPLEVGVYNGLRINPETGHNEKISKLEEGLIKIFSQQVCSKLENRRRVMTIPITSRSEMN